MATLDEVRNYNTTKGINADILEDNNNRLVRKPYKILPILPKMSFSDKMGKFFLSFRTSL